MDVSRSCHFSLSLRMNHYQLASSFFCSLLSKSINLLFILFIITTSTSTNLQGKYKKLGAHRDPLGITWTGKFSSPAVFYYSFVEPDKPVIMKGALEIEDHPGLTNWTDDFLSKKYGSEIVKVEKSKIENRASTPAWIPFEKFLTSYQTEDIYLVHSLNNKMEDLGLIPSTLQCGGFQKVIQEVVLWMGSHTTSSVLHRDPFDNLLCVLSGRKYAVLIDKTYKDEVEETGFDKVKGFSTVDPQRVDFEKFPRLAHVNWHEANLEKGDCLFIPQGWYHQVTSSGYRHLSVNIWFSHLWWFNKTDCLYDISVYRPLEPVSTFGFASPNEAYRSRLLSHFKNKGILHRYAFHELLPTNPTEERANEFFNAINLFPDGALSWSELYAFDIDKILPQFWDLFDISDNNAQNKNKSPKSTNLDVNKDDHADRTSLQDFSQVSGNESFDNGSENSYQETIKNSKINENYSPTGKVDVSENAKDRDYDEESQPLPDAVSGDTPSLPDSSVENPVHESNIRTNGFNQEDVDVNEDKESVSGFCFGEKDCEEEASETLHHFAESYKSKSRPGNDEESAAGSDDTKAANAEDRQTDVRDEL